MRTSALLGAIFAWGPLSADAKAVARPMTREPPVTGTTRTLMSIMPDIE
jgi:hypothetical protein